MIALQQVTKVYPRPDQPDVTALRDVTVTIDKGSFVAVCGPSGCGKSTLLSLIGGLALPTSGTIQVRGEELQALSAARRAEFRAEHIGFVFQMFHLLPYLNLLDNVRLAARSGSDAGEARRRASELLEEFGLDERWSDRPGQLSAGERQRVALARALFHRPSILLADEPTGNLDPDNAQKVLQALEAYRRRHESTIVLVTHHAEAAARTDRVLRLRDGQFEDGEPIAADKAE